jgi:hypothetical protein
VNVIFESFLKKGRGIIKCFYKKGRGIIGRFGEKERENFIIKKFKCLLIEFFIVLLQKIHHLNKKKC